MTTTLDIATHLAVLRGKGATHIVVGYSGGGDDGGVDSVRAVKLPNFDWEADEIDTAFNPFEGSEDIELPGECVTLFKNWLGENYMPRHGWWNNEGGGGTIMLDLERMEVRVEHYDNTEAEGETTRTELPIPEDCAAHAELNALSADAFGMLPEAWVYSDDGAVYTEFSRYDSQTQQSTTLIPVTTEWLNDGRLNDEVVLPYEHWSAEVMIECIADGKFVAVVRCREIVHGREHSSEYHDDVNFAVRS